MTAPPADTDGRTDLDRPVALHALVFLDEGEDVTVGRPDTDSYCVLPADGAALLRELERGCSPRQAADWYAQAYGEPVDVAEFLAAMDELGFTRGPQGAEAGGISSLADVGTGVRQPRWQRLGVWTFSRSAWFCYAVLLLVWVAAMARHPDLLPRTHHLLFTRYATVIMGLGVFGQLPFVLLHESFHALAGRRLGLQSRLRISRRLYFLVIETTLDGLVVVPRRQRYLPILAGMFADLLTMAVLTLAAAGLRHPDGSQPLAGQLCLALAFLTLLRFVWQFYFFLQTDLYQLVVTVLGCVDLQTTASRLIANRVNRLLGRRHRLHDESRWHPRDRAVARWYCWLLIAGYLALLGSFLLAALPVLRRLFGDAANRLVRGQQVSWSSIADSATFLLLTVAQLIIVSFIVLRERRQRRTSVHVIH
ncbi:MAG: hypothetical protein ACR2N4_18850 [Jatrophihabitans sp.]